MPMHDVGYRGWTGALTSRLTRFWTIAATGLSVAFRSHWIKRMMLAAWLPVFGIGIGVYVVESILTEREYSLERVNSIADEAGIDLEDRETIEQIIEAYKPVSHAAKPIILSDNRHDQNEMLLRLNKVLAEKEFGLDDPENKRLRNLIANPRVLFNTDYGRINLLITDIMDADDDDEIREIIKDFSADTFSEEFDAVMENVKRDGEKKLDIVRKLERIPPGERRFFFSNVVFLFDRSEFPPKGALPYIDQYTEAMTANSNASARKKAWSFFLLIFLGYPQGVATLILMALVVPPLISRDLRSRAYFIYFAKPISRLDYLLGKFTIPAVFLFSITTLPALGLFLFAVAMSPDLSVLHDTWDLPFRVICASAVMIIPTVSIALMLSSLTQESRFATFAWFALWILSTGSYMVMWVFHIINEVQRRAEHNMDVDTVPTLDPNWQMISIYHTINNVQSWIFNVTPMDSSVIGGLILLAGLTIVSWVVLFWRVSAPIRI